MTFSVTDAITTGLDRTLKRNSLLLGSVFFVLAALNGLVTPAIVEPFVPEEAAGTPPLDISPLIAVLIYVLVLLAMSVVTVAALRTFVSEETETIPAAYYTENVAFAVLNLLVGGIAFAILVSLGFVALVVPGFFLLVTLYFWSVFVAVENDNFVTAFKRSWGLTKGNRVRLFFLGVAVVLLAIAITVPFSLPAGLVGGAVGALVTGFSTAIISIFGLATAAAAFVQLRDLEDEETGGPDSTPQATPA